MPRRAERRPARNDFPPRRIRTTVPAHSKPECTGAVLLEFDSLIKHYPYVLEPLSPNRTCPTNPLCREKDPNPTRPRAVLTPETG
jgi:hypothetical protein